MVTGIPPEVDDETVIYSELSVMDSDVLLVTLTVWESDAEFKIMLPKSILVGDTVNAADFRAFPATVTIPVLVVMEFVISTYAD